MNGNGNGHGRRRPTKSWPAARRQLFAAAYIRNKGNGTAAAREVGYRGTDASLRVTASRLLTNANVREILDAKLQKAEAAIGGGISEEEVVKRLVDVARLPDTELVDAFDFISLIGPAEAVKGIKAAGDLSEANAVLKMAGGGFYIDLDRAKANGKGRLIKEISHDPETGAPRLKLQDNIAIRELARKAMMDLAKIKGMLRDETPPPPPQNLSLNVVLANMPTPQLAALNAAMEAAGQRQPIPAATWVTGAPERQHSVIVKAPAAGMPTLRGDEQRVSGSLVRVTKSWHDREG